MFVQIFMKNNFHKCCFGKYMRWLHSGTTCSCNVLKVAGSICVGVILLVLTRPCLKVIRFLVKGKLQLGFGWVVCLKSFCFTTYSFSFYNIKEVGSPTKASPVTKKCAIHWIQLPAKERAEDAVRNGSIDRFLWPLRRQNTWKSLVESL